MIRSRSFATWTLLLISCAALTSCNNQTKAPVITLTPSGAQMVDQGQSLNFTANDSAMKGVKWSLGSLGTLTNATATSVTYNAPAVVTTAASDTLTATSLADPTKSVSTTIALTATPAITTTTLLAGTEGTAYSQTIAATGGAGALTFSLSTGSLPAGLTLSGAGVISGTPTGPNVMSSFTVKVTDSSTAGAQSATQNLSIQINLPPAPSITTTSLPAAVEGTAYSQTITATGGLPPYTFTISVGALPAGLTMNTSGAITGTPTGPNVTSNFTVKVADTSNPVQMATKNLSITVNLPPPPSITTTTLPAGVEGTPYPATTIQATGGLTPYTFAVTTGALPAGLTMNASGQVSGTPLGPNVTSNFTVTVTDSSNPPQMGSKNLSITINLPPAPVISPTTLPNGNVGTPYNQTLSVTGGLGPFTWIVSSGPLPAGLILTGNNTTATVSGTPTTVQTNVTFTITVTDTSVPPQSASQAYTVTINPPTPLTITTPSPLPQGALNTAYSTTIMASGGIAPYTFSLDAASNPLPAGLALSNSGNQGVISGTPTAAGTFTIIVDVKDSQLPTAATAQKTFTLVITAAVPACGTGSESLLTGQYAIVLRGFDASGPVGIGATFDADGAGHVAKMVGLEDINSSGASGVQTNLAINTANSSYSVGIDHRGCLTLATPGLTQTFRFSLGAISAGVASNGHIVQFDSTGSNAAGVLRKQTPAAFLTSQITGNYAFGASAPRKSGGKFAVVGMLSLMGGNVNNTSVADFNDNGIVDNNGIVYPVSPITILSGTYAISASGRGTLSFLPSGTGSTTQNVILYVVSSGELLLLNSNPQSTNNLYSGSALQQSGGPFTNSSLNATSVLYDSGLGNSGVTPVSKVLAGLFTPTPSSGTFSFSGQQNSGGNISPQSATGTYSVASNGRVTFAGGGGGGAPIVYLVSANKGFMLFTDSSLTSPNVVSGFVEPQTGGPFSTASANGTYAFGTIQPENSSVSDEAGFAKFDSLGNVSGTSDKNSAGTLTAGSTFTDTYSIDATGLGFIPANCTIGTTCNNIFFVISPTKAVLLKVKTTNTNPSLEIAEQ